MDSKTASIMFLLFGIMFYAAFSNAIYLMVYSPAWFAFFALIASMSFAPAVRMWQLSNELYDKELEL